MVFSSCKLLICVIKNVLIPIDIVLENACGSLDVTALNFFLSMEKLVFYITKMMRRDRKFNIYPDTAPQLCGGSHNVDNNESDVPGGKIMLSISYMEYAYINTNCSTYVLLH